MSWTRNSLFAGAALAAMAATSAAANVLVVRAVGPSAKAYPAGRSLPDDARIALQAGDMLVVLGKAGTRTFRGPGTFSPSAAPAATRAMKLASADSRRRQISAVRTAGLLPRGGTIWDVDVTQSATICVTDPAAVSLWRPDAAEAAEVSITAAGAEPRTIAWPAGEATLAWPGAVVEGSEYRLRHPGSPVPVRVSFKLLPEPPADLPGVAAALIAHGCRDQLDLLVDSAPEEGAEAQ